METIKISDSEVEVTKTKPEEVVKTKYERGFIEEQIVQIQKSKDEFCALRDAELAECYAIRDEMDKLLVVTKEEREAIKVVDNEVVMNEIVD